MVNDNNCRCVQGVGCDAYKCKYNDNEQSKCVAENIKVGGVTSTCEKDTFCSTFIEKA